jgi:hypothetical protein
LFRYSPLFQRTLQRYNIIFYNPIFYLFFFNSGDIYIYKILMSYGKRKIKKTNWRRKIS